VADGARLVLSAVVAGSAGLEIALQVQKRIHQTLVIWTILVATFVSVLMLGAPKYLDLFLLAPLRALALVLPVIACTGASILIFGPIQDRRVAARQRRQWKRQIGQERPLAHTAEPVLD